MGFLDEIKRRRTFAIISHPDAGKTTLTEKLLLFGGAIQIAGAVKSNKIKKSVVGAGHADKAQVGVMVRHLLPGCDPVDADSTDALAVAICHAHHAATDRLWPSIRAAAV